MGGGRIKVVKIWLFVSVAASFALSAILIIGNGAIVGVTDDMLEGKNIDFPKILFPLCMLTIGGTVLAFVKSVSTGSYSAGKQWQLRGEMGKKLLRLPLAYFESASGAGEETEKNHAGGMGELITRLISDMGVAGGFYSEVLPGFLVDCITVVLFTFYFLAMDARLIMALFISYPPMLVLSDRLSRKLVALAKAKRKRMDERTALAYDYVQGIEIGRSFGLYELQKKRMDDILDDIASHAAASTRISSLAWMLSGIIRQVPIVICYLFSLYELRRGRISAGELLSFTILIGYLIYPLGNIIFALNDIREAGVSMERLQKVLGSEEEGETAGTTERLGGEKSVAEETGAEETEEAGREEAVEAEAAVICLRGAGFSYVENRPVLRDISLTVHAGQKIALVGGSGEGKSTVLKLLCALYKLHQGEYFLFGKEIGEWDLQAARECFAYVPQNTVLFPVSVWENVAYGRRGATREEVESACLAANIHEMIQKLPEKYDTIVGERGAKLSGGERQRISIARAILKNAPILLLDEPTSSVDGENERLIVEALERAAEGRTMITVAHRLSTIENADCVYEIENGRITLRCETAGEKDVE